MHGTPDDVDVDTMLTSTSSGVPCMSPERLFSQTQKRLGLVDLAILITQLGTPVTPGGFVITPSVVWNLTSANSTYGGCLCLEHVQSRLSINTINLSTPPITMSYQDQDVEQLRGINTTPEIPLPIMRVLRECLRNTTAPRRRDA